MSGRNLNYDTLNRRDKARGVVDDQVAEERTLREAATPDWKKKRRAAYAGHRQRELKEEMYARQAAKETADGSDRSAPAGP